MGESGVLLDVKEVAAMLSVHPKTVQKWTVKGVLKSIRLAGRRKLQFRVEDVESFILASAPNGSNVGPIPGPTVTVATIPNESHQRLTAPPKRARKKTGRANLEWRQRYARK